MGEKFWLRIREFANNKVKKIYIKKFHFNIKCPKCETWTSEVNGVKDLEYEGDYNLVTCNKCNQVTRWLDLGIIWTSIED